MTWCFCAYIVAGHCGGRSGAVPGAVCDGGGERGAAAGAAADDGALFGVRHDRQLERRGAARVHLLPHLLLGSQPLVPRALRRQCTQVPQTPSPRIHYLSDFFNPTTAISLLTV